MKAAIISAFAIMICIASFPVMFLKEKDVKTVMANILNTEYSADTKILPSEHKTFRIKFSSSGEIKKIDSDEYIIGVLCGEVSPSYSEEALKAQAVAAYSFALKRCGDAEKTGRDYDLTDSPETDQCYIPKKEICEKWGENSDEYYKKIENAVKSVSGQYLSYENSPVLTVYHAVSSGMTNSAKDVWGSDVPYLVSVESVGDKLSKSYLSEVSLNEKDVAEKLKDLCTVTQGKNAFENLEVSKSGRVINAKIDEKTVQGGDIASALSLKSGNFEVSYSGGNYNFTVRGRGHGVGMSQQGAEYMARQGSGYEEILMHYYNGCELKK